MNNKLYFDLICLKAVLARNFGFLTLFPFLAQSFLRAQGLGSAESGIVLLYSEHFGLCRIRSDREKESPKNKPNGMLPKPRFKLNNGDFGNLQYLFVKNKPNGMLYIN